MKRAISFLVLAAMLLSLCACGSKRMEGISDQAYEYGLAALETADEFIDGQIDADTASDRLARNLILVDACDGEHDILVGSVIFRLKIAIDRKGNGTGTIGDVKDARADLADLLGK